MQDSDSDSHLEPYYVLEYDDNDDEDDVEGMQWLGETSESEWGRDLLAALLPATTGALSCSSSYEGSDEGRRCLCASFGGDFLLPSPPHRFCLEDDSPREDEGAGDRVFRRALLTLPRNKAAGAAAATGEDSWTDTSSWDASNPTSVATPPPPPPPPDRRFPYSDGERSPGPWAAAVAAAAVAAERSRDRRRRLRHRRALQRRVDLGNRDREERRLRRRRRGGDDDDDSSSMASTSCAESAVASRSSLGTPARSSASEGSLRAHRNRPGGHIYKAFVKDLKRQIKAEIENEAWETDFKFPDYSVGIIPESYCLRSEYFEYDLLTQFGEIPGYPEGRGILESRSSKIRRGVLEATISRKRKHDEEYEKEMGILNDTKDSGESENQTSVESSTDEPTESLDFFPATTTTIGIQVSLETDRECDKRRERFVSSTTGTDEGYETNKKPSKTSSLNSSKLRKAVFHPAEEANSQPVRRKPAAAAAAAAAAGARPKKLPPLPVRGGFPQQRLNAANSDSRLEVRLLHKSRNLPPIGERGQGDEPCKYAATDVRPARKFHLPSKYPCLPPIKHCEEGISRPENIPITTTTTKARQRRKF